MDPEEIGRLDFAGGQIQALVAFAMAVIKIHPEPKKLEQETDLGMQRALASAETMLVSDDILEGLIDVRDRLKRALSSAVKAQEHPRTGQM